MSQVTLSERLKQRINAVESRMEREWRLYERYDAFLVELRRKLLAEQARLARHARAIAANTSRMAWRAMEALSARLQWFAEIQRMKNEAPAAYDWGISGRGNTAVIE